MPTKPRPPWDFTKLQSYYMAILEITDLLFQGLPYNKVKVL
jgi:hypothetical protein